MPTLTRPGRWDHDRWAWALHNLHLVLLGVALVGTVAAFPAGSDRLVVGVATVALAAADIAMRRRGLLNDRRGAVVGYFLAVGAAVSVVTAVFPTFSLVLFGLLPLAFVRLPPPAAAAVAVVAVGGRFLVSPLLHDVARGLGWKHRYHVVVQPGTLNFILETVLLPLLTGLFTAWAVRALRRQNRRRQELVDQLSATRAELADTARLAGRAEERQRLAHELHDTLAQGLAGVVLQLDAAAEHLDSARGAEGATPGRDVKRLLARARETAGLCLADTRRAVEALRPETLDDASFAEAVATVCVRWSEMTGVPVRRSVAGLAGQSHPQAEVVALRVVQEALTNVAKHAAAGAVTVAVEYTTDELRVVVSDDGCGFDPDDPPRPDGHISGGFGVTVMRQRAAAAGGTLLVTSAPGSGTTVTVALPTGKATTTAGENQ
ncbi:sensor histidine kinase [Jiangella asiatica]|uniref:Oxygen sensor histidine kinase NreB n=1 Tax=Jiangella asiatica TaxID=2530372 RepID=A0A4R5DD12_9ACTN|nr:sensor histidine kinase [Jiangella asiatica]TDE09880.1 sensor histidine kinase [Jiangella asiatica]